MTPETRVKLAKLGWSAVFVAPVIFAEWSLRNDVDSLSQLSWERVMAADRRAAETERELTDIRRRVLDGAQERDELRNELRKLESQFKHVEQGASIGVLAGTLGPCAAGPIGMAIGLVVLAASL